jgi:hypothetical protein
MITTTVLTTKQQNTLDDMKHRVDTIVNLESRRDMSKMHGRHGVAPPTLRTRISDRIVAELLFPMYFPLMVDLAKVLKVDLPSDIIDKSSTKDGATLCLQTLAIAYAKLIIVVDK